MAYGGFLGYSGPVIITENVRNTQQYSYETIVPRTTLPITLALVKEHLKIELTDVSNDLYIELLISATTDFFESYTNRILINTTIETYFDCFRQSFEIARSKFQSLIFFQYLVNETLTDVDSSIYKLTNEQLYSRIYINNITDFPTDKDDSYQSIIVRFIAGYGDSDSDIPSDIKIALLNQVADMYENRGDCDDCSCDSVSSLPPISRMIYNKYRINSAFGSPYRG